MSLGERIKVLRKAQGWTQEDLAERLGMHINTVIRWETNQRIPSIPKMKTLAEALGSRLEYLLGMETDEAPKTLPERVTPESVPLSLSVCDEGKIPLTYWADVAEKAKAIVTTGNKEELSAVRVLLQLALTTVENACLSMGTDVQRSLADAGEEGRSENGKAV